VNEVFAFECGIVGTEFCTIVNARSRGKAKSQYWRGQRGACQEAGARLSIEEAQGMIEHVWTLEDAVAVARLCETELIPAGYHCAIGGSVLHRGWSDKDLDLFIYPHYTGRENLIERANAISKCGIQFIEARDHTGYGDAKEVARYEYNGKRIDIFFLK
jgi:hypothetical protein